MRKNGHPVITLDLLPEQLTLIYEGKLQNITEFQLNKDQKDDKVMIEINLKELLYDYWWGDW